MRNCQLIYRQNFTSYRTSGFGSDQHRKSAICEPFVHIWNHRLLPTPRLHSDPPHPPHLGGDFSPTSPTHAVKHECTVCFETSSKDLYPLLLSTIPSSVFLSMLSVTPTGLKWSISGVEGQTLDSGAMVTLLEADPAHHIALQGHLMVLERYICSIESFFLQQEWRTAKRLQI